MKAITKIIPLICLAVGLLTSCSPSTPTAVIPTVSPTVTPESTKTPMPASPTKVAEQVYLDPDGWYSITFPDELKPTDKPNLFLGQNSSLETGYLPGLGYMQTALKVCSVLVEGEKHATVQTIADMDTFCSISGETDSGDQFTYTVRQNVKSDFLHRFVYVKKSGLLADPANISFATFSWLQPSFVVVPEGDLAPLSASEAAFWAKLGPMPTNVVVTERVALRPGNGSPMTRDGLERVVPPYDEPVEIATPRKKSIQELGYELGHVTLASEGGGMVETRYLYKNGKRLLKDQVLYVSDIYALSTASGMVNVFIVTVENRTGRNDFLIQNDKAIDFGGHSEVDPHFRPVLYQGEWLWAKLAGGLIEIRKSNGDIVFRIPADLMKTNHDRFRGWQGHWVLEVDDFVVMDGEILNTKLGFWKIFKWDLIKDKPVFLFQKGARAGVSYDGQVLPLQYQEIAHGMCCSPAQNNPWVADTWISFYGKRDGTWYSVLVEFK